MTDPIADMLTRIRNASKVHKKEVLVPFSKLKMAIAETMVQQGYLGQVEVAGDTKKEMLITLKYNGRISAIQSIKRISKPGQRCYVKSNELGRVLNGLGVAILSTPKGVMVDKDARKQKLGGELLCEIY